MPLPQSSAYGWLMLAAVAVSLTLWIRAAKRDERLVLIYLAALAGAFLGSKLVFLAAEGWMFVHDPNRWILWATGKTILGAFLGGYAAVEAAKHLTGYREPTGDAFALMAPLGIVIGRVGCLVHGCCLGAECRPAWYTLPDHADTHRWPAVPAEIGFNLVALAAALYLRKAGRFPGQLFHLYLIAYGGFRFVHEFVRATPRWAEGGVLSGYHFAALAVVTLGVCGFWRRQVRSR